MRTFLFLLLCPMAAAHGAGPRVLDSRYHLELVASEPEIVTPVAIAFDREGRLLVIESHTHQRPDDYEGPQFDRIRCLNDTDGDGKLETVTTYYEGSSQTMSLAVSWRIDSMLSWNCLRQRMVPPYRYGFSVQPIIGTASFNRVRKPLKP